MEDLRICTKCPIHHYENCPSCFGFGVYSDTLGDVVHASDAIEGTLTRKVFPCPHCGSTEKGITNNGNSN